MDRYLIKYVEIKSIRDLTRNLKLPVFQLINNKIGIDILMYESVTMG